jgi:Tfp pilus assembly PilM family ATPase/Tfp pilus assembly protein PilN
MKFSFRKKSKIITVLEIDNDWIKIVQAQPFGKELKISNIIAEKITSSVDDKTPDRVSELLKELKINQNFLTVSIPHQLAVIKNLELPSVNPVEVKDMVELQIGKQTPFTKEEIIYDYTIADTNAEGYSRIILVIVHQDVVRSCLKTLEKAGLKTEKIVLGSEGLFAWHNLACKEKIAGKPYALIDVDHDKSDFTVILKDNIIFCRNISIGFSQFLDEPGKFREKFIEEINHSIYAYHSEMINEEISKMIITGAEMLAASLDKNVLKAVVGLPVEIVPQTENILLTEECLSRYSNIAKDVSVSSLFGLALNPAGAKINLIPQQLQIEKGVREKGRDLYFFGMYLAFILATALSVFLGRMYTKEQYLKELKRETFKIQEKVNRINRMTEETEGIKIRTNTKNLVLNFIFEKHKVVPPDIHLTSIRFNGKDRLTIRGVSTVMSEIFRFLNVLEESKYFQDVRTKFVTTRKVKGRDMTEFEIICPLDASLKEQLALLDNGQFGEGQENR